MLIIKLGFSHLIKINQEVQIKKADRFKNYTQNGIFPFKKIRGSNLNNREVQYLLQYQEGQIEKTEQFKKFIKTDFPSFKNKT